MDGQIDRQIDIQIDRQREILYKRKSNISTDSKTIQKILLNLYFVATLGRQIDRWIDKYIDG